MQRNQPLKTQHKIFFIVIIIFIIIVFFATFNFGDDNKIKWGATFSTKQAKILGLNWQEVYLKVIDELPIEVLRIPIYWDEVEIAPGKFDFTNYVWMLNKASERNIEVVPVLGKRLPRWPECHVPEFYENLSAEETEQKILILLEQEVNYFKNYQNIKKWQVENEPFLTAFGECAPLNENFLKQEIELVRSLDSRSIIVTESGELSTWLRGAKLGDILGTSMYRKTWNKSWGYFSYPLGPAYYYFKAGLIKLFTSVDEIINTELQVEPWAEKNKLKELDLFEQFYALDFSQMKSNIQFAKRSGINEIYLWGVEWWWWIGIEHGHWEFWEYGKTLINAN